MRLVVILSLLAAGGCGDAPGTVDLHGFEIVVPEGWTAERRSDGPRRTLTLRPQPPVSFCQLVVIRDGRLFRDDDAQALLGDGLASFGGRGRRDATLEHGGGVMKGFVLDDPTVQRSWGVVGARGEPTVEMYASPRRIRLLAAVIGTWSGEPAADAHRQRCRQILRSIR